MEFVIIYFSGTGNTELISKEIVKRLESKGHVVNLVSIENKEQIRKLDFDNKVIGFGFPVYKFSYPDIFNQFFNVFNSIGKSNKYFLFSTFARFMADSFYDISEKLDENKFHLIVKRGFKAPSCGISARLTEMDYDYESVMFFEDDISRKLDEFVDEFLSLVNTNKEIKLKHSILRPIKKIIVKQVEMTKYPEMHINQDICVLCGKCINHCPDSNLIKRDGYIEIVDSYGCLHCLRCMNHCPVNAIDFGKLTRYDNQYTINKRNELYTRAESGYKEKYWEDFDYVIKKWQRKTIKYWLKHRKRPEL